MPTVPAAVNSPPAALHRHAQRLLQPAGEVVGVGAQGRVLMPLFMACAIQQSFAGCRRFGHISSSWTSRC